MPTVLLVDHDEAARGIVKDRLERVGHRVTCAANAAEARSWLGRTRMDVVLLEWHLPDAPGVGFVRQLRGDSRTSDLPIIFVSARSAEDDIVAALESGADDYVTKPFHARELVARMKSVVRGRAVQTSEGLIESGNLSLDTEEMYATLDGRVIHLGLTEFRLLHFFMTHPDRVFRRGTLLESVWGDRREQIADRTVDVHIRRLRVALSPHQAIIGTVRGEGYYFSAVGKSTNAVEGVRQ